MGSSQRRPIRRLMAKKVFSGLVTAWRLAGSPTNLSPSSVKATIEGVVRMPSAFSITLGFLPSMTATQEFVVPRSIPITFVIRSLSFWRTVRALHSAPANTDARLAYNSRGAGPLILSAHPPTQPAGLPRLYKSQAFGPQGEALSWRQITCVSQPMRFEGSCHRRLEGAGERKHLE